MARSEGAGGAVVRRPRGDPPVAVEAGPGADLAETAGPAGRGRIGRGAVEAAARIYRRAERAKAMSKIIAAIEAEQMSKKVPDFRTGDTVEVKVKVKEGDRERLQAFEGIVIAKRNRGLNSAFTV